MWGLLIPQTPLADKFFHGALVPICTYQRTMYKLSSSIGFENMKAPKIKSGGSSKTPLSGKKVIYICLQAYQNQLPSSINSGVVGPKIKSNGCRDPRCP